MDDDQNRGRQDNYPGDNNRPTNNTNRGGGLTTFLPLIISLISRNPKLLFVLIIAAGLWFFLGGGLSGGGAQANADFGRGMEMSQAKYDQAEVFEPLADNKSNPLPEKVTLIDYAPARLNQGRQGSCVGWASSYAARTILHSRATGVNPNRVTFSPSFVYNQIAIPNSNCQGAYMLDAMKTLRQVGDMPFSQFPYDERTCRARPDQSMRQSAADYRIRGYNRLTKGSNKYEVDMLAMKQNLSQGAPVVIGMQVGGSFMQSMRGKELWVPSRRDYSMSGFGGHAMCVIGYDDYKFGNEGGFQIMNSWGSDWGKDGVGWVSYKDFKHFTKEAYGLYPMGDANKATSNALAINFGLVKVDEDGNPKAYINVQADGANSFSASNPIRPGDRFKVQITNSVECYVYIFGEEVDGSSYVLFPYTKKHSPYCGITGTRLFPRDKSMVADDKGNKDYIAAIFTKVPIDYDQMNRAINNAPGNTYNQKLNNALGQAAMQNVRYTSGKSIGFKVPSMSEQQAVGVVIGFDKR